MSINRIEAIKTGKNANPSPVKLPPVIFGTSGLGNLFEVLPEELKFNIVHACIRSSNHTAVFDTAGKYGAGLSLELLGKYLKRLHVQPESVIISNKLGWLRTELTAEEPTFEPGAWKNLAHDAIQKISYDGILECFEQGNELLGGYIPQMVSVHDPDEYLAAAPDEEQVRQRYQHILEAYRALENLKVQGKVKAIGVGAKNWKVIQRIAQDVPLDWAMIANSMTVKTHPPELINLIHDMHSKGIMVINSAVFHAGFLVGGNFYDYKRVEAGSPEGDALLQWRAKFLAVCQQFHVLPAAACVQFSLKIPGIKSIAMNATQIKHVKENVKLPHMSIPSAFWEALKKEDLIDAQAFDVIRR